MMTRSFAAALFGSIVLIATLNPAAAQSSREVGEMRLYIQQLEDQIRQLTGENEQLRFELRRLQAQAGSDGQVGNGSQPGAGGTELAGQSGLQGNGEIIRGTINPQGNSSVEQGAPPQDLGTLSVAENDPLIAPDGGDGAGAMQPGETFGTAAAGGDAPLDLSALAGGQPGSFDNQGFGNGAPAGGEQLSGDVAGEGQSPQLTASISGSARDEYDLAYGYVLTGDYDLAEAQFSAWLDAFPSDKLADDARFWMAESKLRQKKYQEAASLFLDLHKRVPHSSKGPDTLMKLGVALAGLGEKEAACATFSEVAKKYPDATGATMSRVGNEQQRVQC